MPVLALALYGLLFLSLVAQLAVRRRRATTSGFLLTGTRPGSAHWWAGICELAGFGCGIAAPVLDLTDSLPRIAPLAATVFYVVGIVLWVKGAIVARWAAVAMGDSWRVGVDETERTALVTAGPFRFVRNPIYLGLLLMFAGWALLVPNVAAWLAFGFMVVGLEILVRRVEEPYLHRVHEVPFDAYAARTGRFVPRVGRLHGA